MKNQYDEFYLINDIRKFQFNAFYNKIKKKCIRNIY